MIVLQQRQVVRGLLCEPVSDQCPQWVMLLELSALKLAEVAVMATQRTFGVACQEAPVLGDTLEA